MRSIALAFSALFLVVPGPPTLRPLDEASREPSLVQARDSVIAALKARNLAGLTGLIAKDLRYLDESQAKDGFIQEIASRWDAPSYATPSVIEEMLTALSLGGSFTTSRGSVIGERQFCAPYVYSAYPSSYPQPSDPDGNPKVALRASVAARAKPDPSARIVATLNYAVVMAVGANSVIGSDGSRWTRIEFPPRRSGYVPADSLRDPADYHVCFGARDGRWLITAIDRDKFPYDY